MSCPQARPVFPGRGKQPPPIPPWGQQPVLGVTAISAKGRGNYSSAQLCRPAEGPGAGTRAGCRSTLSLAGSTARPEPTDSGQARLHPPGSPMPAPPGPGRREGCCPGLSPRRGGPARGGGTLRGLEAAVPHSLSRKPGEIRLRRAGGPPPHQRREPLEQRDSQRWTWAENLTRTRWAADGGQAEGPCGPRRAGGGGRGLQY